MIICPLSDLVSRIKTGNAAGRMTVNVIRSKKNIQVLKILVKEGFISSFKYVDDRHHGLTGGTINVKLRRLIDEPCIKNIKMGSTPGLIEHANIKCLKEYKFGIGITILSTSRGFMTLEQARKLNIGGIVILRCY